LVVADQNNCTDASIERPAVVVPITYEIDVISDSGQGGATHGKVPRNGDGTAERSACPGANNEITKRGRRNVRAGCN
jgi:hypothetical protein